MEKITRTTVKAFIRRHRDHLYIRVDSRIDSYDDCKRAISGASFKVATVSNLADETTLGVEGAWFLGRGDLFESFKRDGYEGFEVFNSLCSFVLAVRLENIAAEKLATELPRTSSRSIRGRL